MKFELTDRYADLFFEPAKRNQTQRVLKYGILRGADGHDDGAPAKRNQTQRVLKFERVDRVLHRPVASKKKSNPTGIEIIRARHGIITDRVTSKKKSNPTGIEILLSRRISGMSGIEIN